MAKPLVSPQGGWPLGRAALALGVVLEEEARAGLSVWLDLLAAWNARVDLTAARSADELVDLMVADALVLAAHVTLGARVVDVGSGAGAPGLALALLRPDLHVTLVEPLVKRAAFLRTVVGTLRLSRVTLDARKGEEIAAARTRAAAAAPVVGDAWGVALARATLAPGPWLDLAERLVNDGGSAWVFLAKEPNPTHAAFARADEVSYRWPLTGAARRLVRYDRLSSGRAPG